MSTVAAQAPAAKSGYLPSLDGWRAIAVYGVMCTHEVWSGSTHRVPRLLHDLGGYGVTLFFAISGILITTRILEEEHLLGTFSLKGFYIRRFFRIQPASLVFLAVLALLMVKGVVHNGWFSWVAALFMFENFAYRTLPSYQGYFFVGHFWTLAVEEHFYALLSLVLRYVRRWRVVLFFAAYAVSHLASNYAIQHGIQQGTERRTYWQIPSLCFPAAVALLLANPSVLAFARRYVHPWWALPLWPASFVVHRSLYFRGTSLLDYSNLWQDIRFPEVFFTLMIVSTMLHPADPVTRLLESPALKWIGRLSYSIYLWHVLFFLSAIKSAGVTNHILLVLARSPSKYICSLAVACLSYYLVERPCIRLGHRVARPASPGRPELAVP